MCVLSWIETTFVWHSNARTVWTLMNKIYWELFKRVLRLWLLSDKMFWNFLILAGIEGTTLICTLYDLCKGHTRPIRPFAREGVINAHHLAVINPLGKFHYRTLLSGPLFLQQSNSCWLMTGFRSWFFNISISKSLFPLIKKTFNHLPILDHHWPVVYCP